MYYWLCDVQLFNVRAKIHGCKWLFSWGRQQHLFLNFSTEVYMFKSTFICLNKLFRRRLLWLSFQFKYRVVLSDYQKFSEPYGTSNYFQAKFYTWQYSLKITSLFFFLILLNLYSHAAQWHSYTVYLGECRVNVIDLYIFFCY
jgi:hypothetical protein